VEALFSAKGLKGGRRNRGGGKRDTGGKNGIPGVSQNWVFKAKLWVKMPVLFNRAGGWYNHRLKKKKKKNLIGKDRGAASGRGQGKISR